MQENRYIELLPLYLKSGPKLRAWLNFLNALQVNYEGTIDGIFKILTFQNEVAFNNTTGNFIGPNENGNRLGLEIIAKWFKLNRNFKCKVYSEDDGILRDMTLILTDRELYRLVKTKIWKIGFDGTTESLTRNINNVFNTSNDSTLSIYLYNDVDPASAILRVNYIPGSFSENDRLLFNAGYYNNPVLGIRYTYAATSKDSLIYDLGISYDGVWDEGVELAIYNPSTAETSKKYYTVTGDTVTIWYYEGMWKSELNVPTTLPVVDKNTSIGTMWFDSVDKKLYTFEYMPIYDGSRNEE